VPASPRSKLRSQIYLDVYDLMLQGLSNEEIAERLGINPRTVKYRISGILEATGYTNRIALMAAHGRAEPGKKRREGLRSMLVGERQTEVYDLLVEGASGPQIAKKLGITKRTVKFHMSSILERTEMETHTKLVAAHWGGRVARLGPGTKVRQIVEGIAQRIHTLLDEALRDRRRIDEEIRALKRTIAALEH
jgi:DNA-binding NarL/FixJ family response regulator